MQHIDIKSIQTTTESMPTDFRQAVRMLERPYIPITLDDVSQIEGMTTGLGDIVVYQGRRMTWGAADNGYALMPLSPQYQNTQRT
jgi:hypothetical protein